MLEKALTARPRGVPPSSVVTTVTPVMNLRCTPRTRSGSTAACCAVVMIPSASSNCPIRRTASAIGRRTFSS